jgi:hypothetical protein
MKLRPGVSEALWMLVGSAVLLAVIFVAAAFHANDDPTALFEAKAQRLALVNQIRSSMESSAAAEKSAVLAVTDENSRKFADEARTAMAKAEQSRQKLEPDLLPAQRELFAQFSKDFTNLQRTDEAVLGLAVQNTNLKAYDLTFGPATAAVKQLDAALAPLTSPAAAEARVGTWRLLASLPPHIAEESDAKMDAMEVEMTKLDRQIRRSLDELASPAATAAYRKFSELREQILKLSRENTNVRSLTLSLTQKREALTDCESALVELQQAIQSEVIAKPQFSRVGFPR